MFSPEPRFQFSLRTVFVWMAAWGVLFALARLPAPANAYFAPLYSSLLFAYLGSRSVWLATILGGLGSLVAGCIVMAIDMSQWLGVFRTEAWAIPILAGGCCLPIGGFVGVTVGLLARERRDKLRFKSRLESLYREIATPWPPVKREEEPPPPD